ELAIAKGVVLALAILELGDKELEDIDTKSCKISRRLNWRIMELDTEKKRDDIIDDICSDEELKKVMEGDTSLVSEWDILYSNGSQVVRKDWSSLQIFDWLEYKVQIHLALMSDETLGSFIDDLEYNGTYLNPWNKKITALNGFNYNLTKAFIAYKNDVEVNMEYVRDLISHNYKGGDQVVYAWADHWYKRALKLANMNNGTKFEKNITKALTDKNSVVYQRLLETVPDLEDRQILSQVYFCINNSTVCADSGQYFIADLALVKEGFNDEDEKVWDVIIADIKYKESTDFTKNQIESTNKSIVLFVKSPKDEDINSQAIKFNNDLPVNKIFEIDKDIPCHSYILKIFGDGNGIESTNFKNMYFKKL
ncbi:hypothetical protein, partial [Flammeovirga aprica]